jgi:DNA primase
MVFSARLLDELRSRTLLSDLISRCGIKLVRRGREFVGLCPFHRERTPSFTVVDDKRFFHCFGCGAHGDVFSFVARIHDVGFRVSVEKIAAGLGSQVSRVPRPAANPTTGQRSDNEERNRRVAWRLWTAACDPRGTPVERYLHHRGLELPSMPVLRWAPRCWNRETGRELPAMLARVDAADGKFVAVHRTWLLSNGSGKATLGEPKWSLGPVAGGAVRLASAAERLAITEGIETGLAFMLGSGLATWAALSAVGIRQLILPEVVRDIVIAADPDVVGMLAARAAARRWRAEGRGVVIACPSGTDRDFNDLLMMI